MKTKIKKFLLRLIGVALGIAGIAAFVGILVPADTASLHQQAVAIRAAATEQARVPHAAAPLIVEATLGRTIGEFIGAGLCVGMLAFALGRVAAHLSEKRRAKPRETLIASEVPNPAVVVAMSEAADATASEFDDMMHRDFTPVASLTEAQASLKKRGQRQRERGRAAA